MTAESDATLRDARELIRSNRHARAHRLLGAACRSGKAHAEHWFLLGAVRHRLGEPKGALAAFEQSLMLQPDHPGALNGRAALLAAMDRPDEAIHCLRRALSFQPRNVDAHVNLAILLDAAGDAASAVHHYTEALDIDAQCRPARLNLSALYLTQQRFDAALEAAENLLRADPDDIAARSNAAKALIGMDRYDEAIEACRRILARQPRHVGALTDLGVALSTLGRFDDAGEAFAAARAADPAQFAIRQQEASTVGGTDLRRSAMPRPDAAPDPRAIYLVRGAERLARCDWTQRADYLANFERIVRKAEATHDPVCEWSLPFASAWLPLAHDVRLAVARAVGRSVETGTAHLRADPGRPVRRADAPLRIGYVSPKFRNHPGATLCPPLLEQHDRRRVEIFGYAMNPRDEGAVAERFRRSCDHVRECWGKDDAGIARQMRDDGIHILVDVGGYTDYARPEVFALRPAPIQVAYLGFMTSLQAGWIDYFVTDAVATPGDHADQWREKLVHLPRTLLCYDRPPHILPPPPARNACGLPEAGFVFCCFNNAYKIEPRAFAIWMRLLHRVPDSVLWLLRDRNAERNLRSAALAHGIDPGRLVFADRIDRAAHLARQQHADLFLDTFDYNAHTTAAEAYYAGLPVLTLPGHTTVARCGASIAHGVGMTELIAVDEADYERLALRFAAEPARLAALKSRLKEQRLQAPLFDAASLARAFEAAFETMWTRHAAGAAPASFAVGLDALEGTMDRARSDPRAASPCTDGTP